MIIIKIGNGYHIALVRIVNGKSTQLNTRGLQGLKILTYILT